jgi:hypothetical protein
MRRKVLRIAGLVLSAVLPLLSQQDDGPGRGVARISVINGDVSVRRGDSGDVVAAAINAPLVVQDRVLTGTHSRAEVQFDWANMIRLTSNGEIRLNELEYKRYIIQIARGTVTFRVLRDHDAEVEISTPSVSVRPVKRGSYRLTVREDGTSEITVRSGEAEVYTPRGSERLKSGRTMQARGTTADPEYQLVNNIPEDDWDRWNERRDSDLERSRSYNYVSRDIYGADDLDNHGRWVQVQPYGWVWTPAVAVGWAPYRYGRWAWIDYYGWSWISYDPWGWAPYHYGRWFYGAPYGWCWYPGSVAIRHYWSPALVAFVGFGPVGVGFGFGRVGWIPLAPYEPFYRWYGPRYYGGYRSATYVDNRVNIVNNVNVTNIYRNARITNGVTAIDGSDFGRGRGGSAIRLSDHDFHQASVMRGQLPITPTSASLRLADRDATVRGFDREPNRFFSHRQATAVDRVPFENQRRSLEQATRRTFGQDPAHVAGAVPDTPRRGLDVGVPHNSFNNAASSPSQPAADNTGRGWRRIGENHQRDAEVRVAPPESRGDSNGWHRFGAARVGETGGRAGSMDQPRENSGGRFGEPSTTRRSIDGISRGSDDGNGRRFEGRNQETDSGRSNSDWRRGVSPSAEQPARSERFDSNRSGSRFESPRMEQRSGGGNGDSVRISPSIVRDRGDSGSRGEVRSGGGFGRADLTGGSRSFDRGGDSGGGSPRMGGASGGVSPRSGGDGGAGRGAGGGGARGGEARGGEGRSGRGR